MKPFAANANRAAKPAKGASFTGLAEVIRERPEAVEPGSECETTLETVEKDGVIQKIIVRCRCGEITEIDCRYPDPEPVEPAS